MQIPNNCWS